VINSAKELKKIVSSSVELPEIDFGKYTLIIGQQVMSSSSFYVLDQNLDVGSAKITLNLTVKRHDWAYGVFTHLYFGGLYSKLPNKNVSVNVIYEK
jgi:hypothetical protein